MDTIRILVVDDEEKIRELIGKYLQFAGYAFDEAENGMQAVACCNKHTYDLIIMDVMMPELDGFSAVKEIRKTRNTPVIMLTARGEEYDRIHGFEAGVDDYVTKPFSPRELMLRVEAVLRRTRSDADERTHESYTKDGLTIDFTAMLVYVDGERVSLTPKEYDLLSYFVRNRNIALTRERLLTEVWGYDFYGDDRTLDTHVKMLRKTLGVYSRYVATLRGTGYRFDG